MERKEIEHWYHYGALTLEQEKEVCERYESSSWDKYIRVSYQYIESRDDCMLCYYQHDFSNHSRASVISWDTSQYKLSDEELVIYSLDKWKASFGLRETNFEAVCADPPVQGLLIRLPVGIIDCRLVCYQAFRAGLDKRVPLHPRAGYFTDRPFYSTWDLGVHDLRSFSTGRATI